MSEQNKSCVVSKGWDQGGDQGGHGVNHMIWPFISLFQTILRRLFFSCLFGGFGGQIYWQGGGGKWESRPPETFFKQLVIFSSVRCGSARLGNLGAGFMPNETKIASILGKWKLFCAYWLQFCLNFQFLTRPVWRKISKDICCCNKFRKIKADKEH